MGHLALFSIMIVRVGFLSSIDWLRLVQGLDFIQGSPDRANHLSPTVLLCVSRNQIYPQQFLSLLSSIHETPSGILPYWLASHSEKAWTQPCRASGRRIKSVGIRLHGSAAATPIPASKPTEQHGYMQPPNAGFPSLSIKSRLSDEATKLREANQAPSGLRLARLGWASTSSSFRLRSGQCITWRITKPILSLMRVA